MELIGALSNPATRNKLAKLNAIRERLLQDAPPIATTTSRPPARAGDVARTVDAVLASHGLMRVGEIHQAVEQRLNRPVNRKTVKAYLSEGTLAATPKFVRSRRGRYRLASWRLAEHLGAKTGG